MLKQENTKYIANIRRILIDCLLVQGYYWSRVFNFGRSFLRLLWECVRECGAHQADSWGWSEQGWVVVRQGQGIREGAASVRSWWWRLETLCWATWHDSTKYTVQYTTCTGQSHGWAAAGPGTERGQCRDYPASGDHRAHHLLRIRGGWVRDTLGGSRGSGRERDGRRELRVSGQFGMVWAGEQNTPGGGQHSSGSAAAARELSQGGGAAREEARPGEGDTPRLAPAGCHGLGPISVPWTQLTPGHHSPLESRLRRWRARVRPGTARGVTPGSQSWAGPILSQIRVGLFPVPPDHTGTGREWPLLGVTHSHSSPFPRAGVLVFCSGSLPQIKVTTMCVYCVLQRWF